jgi:hypothetical protein
MRRISDVFVDWLDTSETPVIKIQGDYLERFGFPVGTNIKIDVAQGRITITPILDGEEDLF